MATNRKLEDGRFLWLDVGASKNSGDHVLVGAIPGVALMDTNASNETTVDTGGVYDLEVQANDTAAAGAAVSVGQKIYYDDGASGLPAGTLTPDDTNGTFFGYALEAISSGTTATIKVKLGY